MSKVIEIQPHMDMPAKEYALKIFLAGTIEMGKSIDWQSDLIDNYFKKRDHLVDIHIYNPRRDEGFDNDPAEMEYQVNWELSALEDADIIIMNLLPDSKSPISLMELGLFASRNFYNNSSKALYVICPQNFYRYDNVRIVCKRYNVPLFHNMLDFLKDFE